MQYIDSLLLKSKKGCFPSWHDIKSKGLEETKPNKLTPKHYVVLHEVEMHDLIESNINSMYDKT